ncbi:MAG TPA: RagB/SusD family nutrient uptake outer membrane protein [Chitinophagaceae bacterium]|nr:RagB/SusD family nutrient uptake outer membrane protein [Chitinophagaceae bacterium]
MKKLIIYIPVVAALIMIGGCKKFLDQKPRTAVATTEFFKSMRDVDAAVAGMYSSWQREMTNDGGTGFAGQYFAWGEMRSDNFDDNGQYASTSFRQLAQNTLTSGNTSSNWTGLYRTIGRANTNIRYVPQASQYDANATPNALNNALAQCYAMRAICYFYIVRVWGDAVVWTEPYDDVTKPDQKARSPRDSVINNVILPDLEKAYSLIPKNQTPVVWNIGEAAICAIAADVMMWKKDYTGAIGWITKLFAAKGPTGKVFGGTSVNDLELKADWKSKLFLGPTGSKESIWSIHWDKTYNGCACIPVSMGNSNNWGRTDSVIHADWKKTRTDSIRWAQTIDTLTGLGHQDKLIKYFNMSGQFNAGTTPATEFNVYLVMYRLADVYLSLAEAYNGNNDIPNALKYLNFVRTRPGNPAYLAADPLVSTKAAMENTILKERQYELFGEGKRWFDLVRTGKVLDVMDPILKQRQRRIPTAEVGFGIDLNKILWPLHRTLLEDNDRLQQNPSYN